MRFLDVVFCFTPSLFTSAAFLFDLFTGVLELSFCFRLEAGDDGGCAGAEFTMACFGGKVNEAAAAFGFFFLASLGYGVLKHLLWVELSIVHPHRVSISVW